MGFFINASKNKKRQKAIFLVTAVFVAAGLVVSSLIGVFGGRSQENYVDTVSRAPVNAGQTVAELEKKLKENPGDVDILSRLAGAYYNNGQVDKSLETYKKALQIDPGNSDLRTSLAVTYFLENKPDKAVTEIREEIKQNPGNKKAHYYLGQFLAYGEGNYSEAVEELQTFIDAAGTGEMNNEVTRAKQMIEELKSKK